MEVLKWEFGGEGEVRSGPGSGGEGAVGRFWHGPGRKGKRERDEAPGPGPERGSEDGRGARAGERLARVHGHEVVAADGSASVSVPLRTG